MRQKRLVKIISVDKRYISTPYPFVPVFDGDINTFLTGQHIDSRVKGTHDNLSVEEMTNVRPLTAEKAAKFKFVINPLNEYPIINGMVLDITKDNGEYVNARDGALYDMWKNHGYKIAHSRLKVRKGYDYFYIKDEYEEAVEELSHDDLVYDAMKLVKEKTHVGNYADIAMLISYRVKGFFLTTDNKSEVVIKNKLLQVCKEKPKEVIECFNKSADEDIKVLKFSKYNILQKRGSDFFDGDRFIGRTIKDVLSYMRDPINVGMVDKWNKLLEGKERPVVYNPAAETNQNVQEDTYYESLRSMTLEELKKECANKKVYWGNYKTETDPEKLIAILSEK